MSTQVEFIINDFLTLKLEGSHTYIYVKGTRFIQCIRLILELEKDQVSDYDEIESIDEAADLFKQSLWENKIVEGPMAIRSQFQNESITPEEEFWGHCSNIQAWVESGYNTKLPHRSLAFSLLKKLTDAGDSLARVAFKDEISSRYLSKHKTVKLYLIENLYLYYLKREELQAIVETEDLEELRKEYLDDVNMQVNFANIYLQMDMNQKALEVINFVRTHNPENVWNRIALAYFKLHQLEEIGHPQSQYLELAIEAMEYDIELNPKDYHSLSQLALFYTLKNEFTRAKELLERSVQVEPSYVGNWLRFGILYQTMHNYKKAIEMYTQVLKIDAFTPHLHNNIAGCYYEEKDYQQSIIYAKKELERDPLHYESLYFLGSSLAKLGEYERAVPYLKKALDCDEWYKTDFASTDVCIWKELAEIYMKTEDTENALSAIRKVIASEPENQEFIDLLKKINID